MRYQFVAAIHQSTIDQMEITLKRGWAKLCGQQGSHTYIDRPTHFQSVLK